MQRMSLKESIGKFKTSLQMQLEHKLVCGSSLQMQPWEYIFLAIWLISGITVGCILTTFLPVVNRETQVPCNTTGKTENSSAVPPHSRFYIHPLPKTRKYYLITALKKYLRIFHYAWQTTFYRIRVCYMFLQETLLFFP